MEYRELLRTLDNDESVRTFMDGKLNERGEMAQVFHLEITKAAALYRRILTLSPF